MWEKTIRDYLNTHTCEYGNTEVTSMLEFLWDNYTYYNPQDSVSTRSAFQRMDTIVKKMSWDEQNLLMDTISELCLGYERKAFTEGIFVGAKLVSELTQMDRKG